MIITMAHLSLSTVRPFKVQFFFFFALRHRAFPHRFVNRGTTSRNWSLPSRLQRCPSLPKLCIPTAHTPRKRNQLSFKLHDTPSLLNGSWHRRITTWHSSWFNFPCFFPPLTVLTQTMAGLNLSQSYQVIFISNLKHSSCGFCHLQRPVQNTPKSK